MLCTATSDISSSSENINSTAVFQDYLSVSYDYWENKNLYRFSFQLIILGPSGQERLIKFFFLGFSYLQK